MKKIVLILFFIQTYLSAQVVTSVAPLKPGNKWVYYSEIVFQGEIKEFEVTDSIKIMKDTHFIMYLVAVLWD